MTPDITLVVQAAAIYTATIGAICAVLYIVKAGNSRRADEAHYRAEERRYRFEQLGGGA